MKAKVTKTAMKKKWGNKIFYVPNNTMERFDRIVRPVAYSTRVEGWACDYYEFDDFCISEGYSPVGPRIMDYSECVPFYKAASKIKGEWLSHDEQQKRFENLLNDFLGTIREKIGKR